MRIYNYNIEVYTQNFKSKSEAYWVLINAINDYNEDLDYYIRTEHKRCEQFSNYKPVSYIEFELIKTNPIQEK
jgi:hypothetical protein